MRAGILAAFCVAAVSASHWDEIIDNRVPLPPVWRNKTDQHATGDTTSMFTLVRSMVTDAVLDQWAVENAYSRAYVDKNGKPCSNPGNAAYVKDHLFQSPTADGHTDEVLKWETANPDCHLPYDIDFKKEMANKTVLFVGNSLSRGTFWQLSSLIEHNSEVVGVDRELQKAACSKTSNRAVSCHLRPPGTPNMFFSWIQTLDHLSQDVPKIHDQLPKAPDMVVFNLGLQHLLFDKTSWFNKQQKWFPEVIKAMRSVWPNTRIVYLPVSPANENNERVRQHWHLENLSVLRWNREVFEMVEDLKVDWIPVVEPVMRGWYQQLAYDRYGYMDHFHPSAHLYSLWCRMLLSILRQPVRAL